MKNKHWQRVQQSVLDDKTTTDFIEVNKRDNSALAQIIIVLIAVILAALFGYRLSELKWRGQSEFNLLKCAEIAQFDNIEETLTKSNETYVAPLFD